MIGSIYEIHEQEVRNNENGPEPHEMHGLGF